MRLMQFSLKVYKKNWIYIFLLFAVSTKIYSNLGLGCPSNGKEWKRFARNIVCTISSDIKYARPDSNVYPVFSVKLKYTGSHTYNLYWDKNFGRVLWEGQIVLESRIEQDKENTSSMKYRTSNTYKPRKTVRVKKGDVLISYLNFHKLPGRYAKNLFNKKGKVQFSLYVVIDKKIKTVSNKMIIDVK